VINVSLTLGSSEVVTGVFNLIAFNITSAAVTINGANQTAYVPANRINVPIIGGVSVSKGNSSGVLVDLSPEVVPYQNGTSISYVLVPAAKSLPIPANVWNITLENKGATIAQIQNQSWVQESPGKVVVTGIKITPNSFSMTVQNTGKTNAIFSSIGIGAVTQLNACVMAPSAAPAEPAHPTANTTTVTISTPSTSYSGQQLVTIGGKVSPVPTASAVATIIITNPNGAKIESTSEPIQPTGAFFSTFTTDYPKNQSSLWIAGQYTITVTYNGATGTAAFSWNPQASSFTSSTTTKTTSSVSTTSSTGSTTTSSTTKSPTSSTTSSTTHSVTSSSTISSTHSESNTQTSKTISYTSSLTTTKIITSQSSPITPTSITVVTNQPSYSGQVKILVSGAVQPVPTTQGYSVVIRVINPMNAVIYSYTISVSSTGQFNASLTAGAVPSSNIAPLWINGTYFVYASHDALTTFTKFTWSGPSPITSHTTTVSTTRTSTTTTNTGIQIQNYICGLYATQNTPGIVSAFPIAYYEVLSNKTLIPINYTAIILDSIEHPSGPSTGTSGGATIIPTSLLSYTLQPNQTVTFTYTGTINTLSAALLSLIPKTFAIPSSLFSINPGQEYAVVASGSDTKVVALVNATAS
jgi:hypothetical protein